jgi:hypothetical protein
MTNHLRISLRIVLAAILAAALWVAAADVAPAPPDPAFHVRWVDGINDPHRIYPGIEARFQPNPQRAEYALNLEPGVRPDAIAVAFDRADRVEVEAGTGDLLLTAGASRTRFPRPIAFQLIGGTRVPVAARFVVDARGHVRYHVGAIDPRARLFIH